MALGRLLQQVSYEPRAEAFLFAHDFIERGWKPRVLSTLKLSTQSSYHANLNRYVVPWLQGRRLRDVRRSDVQGWIAALSQSGLARQSIKNAWSVLSAVLRTAMDWGDIEDNPARGMRLPSKQSKQKLFLPSPEQVAKILKQLCSEVEGRRACAVNSLLDSRRVMARLRGFEPPTSGSGDQ